MAHFGAFLFFLFYLAYTTSVRALAEKRGNENIRVDLYNIEAAARLIDVPKDILDGVRSKLLHSDSTHASGYRSGQASETHRCDVVSGVPTNLGTPGGFIRRWFYKKYTHAYGIPVVSSGAVSDAALKVACYIVRLLFADRRDVRNYFYRYNGRVAVIGAQEHTTTIPEFSHLPDWWNKRARGLGGTLDNPISTGGEENLLCWNSDRYKGQDIFLHETSHSVAEVSIRAGAVPGFYPKLQRHYNYCRRTGALWRNTYAMSTVRELFAHGTQSYFDCNYLAVPPNGIHNHVNNRAKLRTYDPTLFRLLKEVYPCMNKYYWCHDWRTGPPPDPKMNCDGSTTPKPKSSSTAILPTGTPPTTPKVTPTSVNPQPTTVNPQQTTVNPQPTTSPNCKDNNRNCASWAAQYCNHSVHGDYMKKNCKKSCKLCGGGGGCQDNGQYCGPWAQAGYCQSSDHVRRNCRKSCGTC